MTFTLFIAIAGTSSLVSAPVSCYTDANGAVVGLPNSLVTPSLSTNTGPGTLAAGTYYVKLTHWVGSTETATGPEGAVLLAANA